MLNKLSLYYNTLKFLRWPQIWYRLFYFARAKVRQISGHKYLYYRATNASFVKLSNTIELSQSYFGNNEFVFLNKRQDFKDSIDWNCFEFGKLWTYNLNYFDFLNQVNSKKEESLRLMEDFIKKLPALKDANEPYPISLRLINWVKFLSKNQINDPKIDGSLSAQAYILKDKLEYHLLGNHLLENSFGLLFTAYYLKDKTLYKTAKKIMLTEFKEQVLPDGGHFELSPMYHQIILIRVLDCYNLVINNSFFNNELATDLKHHAQNMLGWLNQITFKDGSIPHLNDSTNGITPSSEQLFDYAKKLGLETHTIKLKESGYRKIVNSNYEAVIDVGEIGPSYLPGHAHADTFNFVLYWNNKPIIVDMGTSTYESNALRTNERITHSHNTVTINNTSQSQVWGGFRVAKRANILELNEHDNSVEATHNGYQEKGILHKRNFTKTDNEFVVLDEVIGDSKDIFASFHLDSNIEVSKINETTYKLNDIFIIFEGIKDVKIEKYELALGFNKKVESLVFKVWFENRLKTSFSKT